MTRTSFFDELDFEPGEDDGHAILPEDIGHLISDVAASADRLIVDELVISPRQHVIRTKPRMIMRRIIQFSDPHLVGVGETLKDVDTFMRFERCVETALRMPQISDASTFVISGDIAHDESRETYERLNVYLNKVGNSSAFQVIMILRVCSTKSCRSAALNLRLMAILN